MEFYLDLFEPMILHVQEYATLYAIGTPLVLIIITLTYRYSVPLILYAAEFMIYAFVLHTAVHVVVRLTAWFRNTSSMQALREDGLPADAVFWTTPWLSFWEFDLYDPAWLVWVEVVFLVGILAVMIRYRPMKVQKKRQSRYGTPPPPPPKPGAAEDDDWGVPKKRYHIPAGKNVSGKQR